MKETAMTRREFFIGATVASTLPVVAKAMMSGGVDDHLSVFLSDIHVSGENVKGTVWGDQPTYQNPLFEKVVDEILAMRPRPKRVVCFGDVALWFGYAKDYEASLPGFKRLTDAGIKLYITMGNHDRRDIFLKYHPQYAKSSPVPGRIVSIVNLGTCDLILLDSLNQTGKKEGDSNPVAGTIDAAQWDWLKAEAKRRTRPFLCGAHHPPQEMTREIDGKKANVLSILRDAPMFRGWIHGHDHTWSKDFLMKDWGSRTLFRKAVLPSTGWWGDIGYAVMRTFADRAELSLVQNDFFFPNPLKADEKRPQQWDEIIVENRGARCTFLY